MSDSQHTQLPKVLVDAFSSDPSSSFRVYRKDDEMSITDNFNERKQIAKEMMHRVNSYETLVEALRDAESKLTNEGTAHDWINAGETYEYSDSVILPLLDKLRAALKLAEEGESHV